MQEVIDLKLAANDKLAVIEQKIFLIKLFIITTIIIMIAWWLNIGLQASILGAIVFGYFYQKELKEKNRMIETYEL